MTKTIEQDGVRVTLIENEEPGDCQMCNKNDELRPYGPNGENVCVECAMKDKKSMVKRMYKRMYDLDLTDDMADLVISAMDDAGL